MVFNINTVFNILAAGLATEATTFNRFILFYAWIVATLRYAKKSMLCYDIRNDYDMVICQTMASYGHKVNWKK